VLSGNSLIALRLVPALVMAALVALTAAMSRLLGAGPAGQVLAALSAATCAEFLGAMHLLTTTTPDFLFWAITLLLVIKLLLGQDPRWWIAIGGCAGLASEFKWNIFFLLASVAAGVPVWVSGLAWTLRHPAGRPFRCLGIAAIVVIVIFFVLGGKPYYPGGIFTFLLAAGSVPLERWLTARGRTARGHSARRPGRGGSARAP
jgi:Dolichyl-phosphate-mannose-protein mannosyltransferase